MQIRTREATFSLTAALTALMAPLASAQVTPGQVGDTLKRPEPLQSAPQVPLPAAPTAPRTTAGGGRTIVVDHFNFEGNTVASAEELQALVQPYCGRPVTLLEIYAAADRIAAYYASRGYALASVNVPPQKVESGAILLQITEGRIERIDVENAKLYKPEQIRRELPEIEPGTIYKSDTFKDGMRRLNTLPGLRARAILKPGAAYGTSDMIVRVDEDPFSGSATIDNYGRKNIGEFRLSATATLNNPLRLEDQLNVIGLISQHSLLRYAYIDYSLPVSRIGTRLKGSFSDADFEVDDLPVDGKNRSGRLSIEQTLFLDRGDLLSLNAGISRTESDADLTGLTFIDTEITLAEIGALWNHSYRNAAISQLSTSLSSNFSRLTRMELVNASAEHPVGDQRLRWEVDAQHLQPLPGRFQALLHLNGVYSPDPLADTEAYSLGGPNSVRGYPSAEVRGDRGFLGSLTLRRPVLLANMQWAARVFIDGGKVYAVDPLPGMPGSESLTSTGLGLDWAYWRMSAHLDWSFPLDDRAVSDDRDTSRVFGTLSIAF